MFALFQILALCLLRPNYATQFTCYEGVIEPIPYSVADSMIVRYSEKVEQLWTYTNRQWLIKTLFDGDTMT